MLYTLYTIFFFKKTVDRSLINKRSLWLSGLIGGKGETTGPARRLLCNQREMAKAGEVK